MRRGFHLSQLLAEPDATVEAVERELRSLERLVAENERLLTARNWDGFEDNFRDQRRVTHALQNAMEEAGVDREGPYGQKVMKRLRYIYAVRQNQMERLKSYQGAIKERLNLLSRWKQAAAGWVKRRRDAGASGSFSDLR